MENLALRQRIRRALMIVFFVLFPVIMNFVSPIVTMLGASEGIVTASFIIYLALLIASLYFGRIWCGWICPFGGMQECATLVNDRRAPSGNYDIIKYILWFPWLAAIVYLFINAGGFKGVNPLYVTEGGISALGHAGWLRFAIIGGGLMILSFLSGRRWPCHYICLIAPFMVIGRKIGNKIGTSRVSLEADSELCIQCGLCSQNCPMSLNVQDMVKSSYMEHPECIHCASCADICPKGAITFRVKPKKIEEQLGEPKKRMEQENTDKKVSIEKEANIGDTTKGN